MTCTLIVALFAFIYHSIAEKAIFPPNKDVYLDWNIRIEVISERGRDLFKELFNDLNNLEIEILSSYSTWSESPLYVDTLNSILFSSPSDRNIYQYNLNSKQTTLLIENAGEFGGIYDGDIPLNECLECGPNGMVQIEDYVFVNQLALRRIIAFDPLNIDNLGGIQLNSPNDITTTIDGKTIYFTDPTFGLQREGDIGFIDSFHRSELGFQGVYRVDYTDIMDSNTEPKLVIDDMDGPNGLAVTNDNKYLIVSNTGNKNGWSPFWNIYEIPDCGEDKKNHKYDKYELIKTIPFNMNILAWNSWIINIPLVDGMEIYNDNILLAVCPNGICLIDLKYFKIVGRISIDHLIYSYS